jgi:hypothetical protein
MASRPVPDHEIVIIPQRGQEDREWLLQQCFRVRIDVFHHEQKFPLETELDEFATILPPFCRILNDPICNVAARMS